MNVKTETQNGWSVITISPDESDYALYNYDFFARLNKKEKRLKQIAKLDELIGKMFEEAKGDVKKFGEFVCVLNHKMWHHSEHNEITLAKLYQIRYRTYHQYALDNFVGDDLYTYLDIVD